MKKLLIICTVVGFVFALGNTAMAATWTVPGDFDTIQDAVDAAITGDKITVENGTYSESVIVDGKDLSLKADGDNVIIYPGSCSGHDDAIQAYNGSVSVEGFIVNATNCKGGIYAMGGFPGSESVRLSALNNTVHSYKKNGITVNGPEAYGHIQGNTVMGSGEIGVPHYAQNGIQFGFGGTGQAMGNSVEGNWYIGPDWGATGILVFESDRVLIQNNTVVDCAMGVALETWGWYFPSANYNTVISNTIEGAQYGVSVAAYDWSYSAMDSFADNNKVVNNSIKCDNNGDTGIFVGVANDPENDYEASAHNNKVIGNTIHGYETPLDEGGTATKVRANVGFPY